MFRCGRLCLTLTLLVGAAPTHALAQATTTGIIKGTVTDSTGGVLPGVTLTITGPNVISEQVSRTNESGLFQFLFVPVGVVNLTAELSGFETITVSEIVINPGSIQSYEFVMSLSGVTEQVSVSATPLLVERESTSNKTLVDAVYTNITPLLDRNYQEVTTLFPGVHKEDTPPTFVPFGVFGGIHIRGSRDRSGGFRVDGATLNDPYEGAAFVNINQNAIERYELISGGYQPEYGEQSGGVVNLITKAGGSSYRYHGGFFYRHDALASGLPTELPGQINSKAPQNKQFYELSVGGPIREKAQFFAAIDVRDFSEGTVFTPEEVRTETSSVFGNARIDFLQSPSNSWVFSLFVDRSNRDFARLGNGILPEASFDLHDRAVVGIARETHIFDPTLVLESQFLLNYRDHDRLQSVPDAGPNVIVVNADATTLETGAYFAPQDYKYSLFRISEKLTKLSSVNHPSLSATTRTPVA